jgi:hypothetical protein
MNGACKDGNELRYPVVLFFDEPLALKHFHEITPCKEKAMKPHQDECNNANWRFVYTGDKSEEGAVDEDAYYVETLLRELQAMASNESMMDYKESWNLVDYVFK